MRPRQLIVTAVALACLCQATKSAAQDAKSPPTSDAATEALLADFNDKVYYKNKLEFSVESGWLPINIPFVFDFILGGGYSKTPLNYTLVPTLASLRWQVDSVRGPSIFRGNWDVSCTAAITAIPRGPETNYEAFDLGIRRNFVRPNWRVGPYVDGHVGAGRIDAKGPEGVLYSQGQNFTFTIMLGSGVRYNFNPRYSLAAGMNYMHVSNAYISEPKYPDYGINVYGPMFGFIMKLGK